MAQALIGASTNAGVTQNVNQTRYTCLGRGQLGTQNTETIEQWKVRTAGTYSQLSAYVSANTYDSATLTLRFRKNAGNGNQVLSVAAGATGLFVDASNSDAVVADDLVCVSRVSSNAGAGSSTLRSVVSDFAASSGYVTLLLNGGATNVSAASTTDYHPFASTGATNATEANVQFLVNAAGTARNFSVNVSSNARSSTTTYRFRKNGADGNGTVSFGSGATGITQDTSNTDSLAAADLIDYSATTGTGTGAIIWSASGCEFSATGTSSDIFNKTGAFTASATAQYRYVLGNGGSSTTEADSNIRHQFALTASKLNAYVSANTSNGTTTIRFRKNAGNGNQVLSVTSGSTGSFQDTTNSDVIAASDDCCISVSGGTSGTFTFQTIGMLETVAAANTGNFLLFF